MTPAELVARHKHILLDFDGPVCAVFGGEISDRDAADELKTLAGPDLPDDIAAAHDPFDVLRYANTIGNPTASAVETRFRELELDAVTTAPETPGARATIEALVDAGHVVAIVSNNSAAAVRRYLDLHGLTGLIKYVSARESANAQRLKPDAYLLNRAIDALDAQAHECIMIGDSATDVQAANVLGVATVGYANKPGKEERLRSQGAATVLDHMCGIAT